MAETIRNHEQVNSLQSREALKALLKHESITLVPGTTLENCDEPFTYQTPAINTYKTCVYYQNNGIIGIIDANGIMHVTPATIEKHVILEQAGYELYAISVPLSNGENFADPKLEQKWKEMKGNAHEIMQTEIRKNYRAWFKDMAERRGLKPVLGEWLVIDGIELAYFGQKMNVPTSLGENGISEERQEQIGTYDYNNGVIAFVDREGHLCVGPYSEERISALNQAGYKKGSVHVPLSNGELPTDEDIANNWANLKK